MGESGAGSGGIESSEKPKQTFMVRESVYGEPIVDIITTKREESVWQIGRTDSRRGQTESTTNVFKLDEKAPLGKAYEFGGKFYKVVEPKFKGMADKFGATSVFVEKITYEQYQELVKPPTA